MASAEDSRDAVISHPNPAVLYHSVGDVAARALADVDPKLQYGVESIKSLGMNALAAGRYDDSDRALIDPAVGCSCGWARRVHGCRAK